MSNKNPFQIKQPNFTYTPTRHPLDEKTIMVCGWKAPQFSGATTIFAPTKDFVQGLVDKDKLKTAWIFATKVQSLYILNIRVLHFRGDFFH